MRNILNLIYAFIVLIIGLYLISALAEALKILNFGYIFVGLFVVFALFVLLKEVLD